MAKVKITIEIDTVTQMVKGSLKSSGEGLSLPEYLLYTLNGIVDGTKGYYEDEGLKAYVITICHNSLDLIEDTYLGNLKQKQIEQYFAEAELEEIDDEEEVIDQQMEQIINKYASGNNGEVKPENN